MNTLQFKTTIKCSGCIQKTTPYLNEVAGEGNWKVDVQDPAKVLTVSTDGKVTAEAVTQALEKAGYKAEEIR